MYYSNEEYNITLSKYQTKDFDWYYNGMGITNIFIPYLVGRDERMTQVNCIDPVIQIRSYSANVKEILTKCEYLLMSRSVKLDYILD